MVELYYLFVYNILYNSNILTKILNPVGIV